ncbi:MAG: hypothetical protein QY323_00405 [Patescibacteria group bacterium]|nr:MAG: hypothetical protein QY323_00405 [Patescibacteria group bacterium]
MSCRAIEISGLQLRRIVRWGVSILTDGPNLLPRPSTWKRVCVDLKPVTLTGDPSFLRRLKQIEMVGGKNAVLVTAQDIAANSALARYLLCAGWTIIARGNGAYAVQKVIFRRPIKDDLVGEIDQHQIFQVPTSALAPWGGTLDPITRAAS